MSRPVLLNLSASPLFSTKWDNLSLPFCHTQSSASVKSHYFEDGCGWYISNGSFFAGVQIFFIPKGIFNLNIGSILMLRIFQKRGLPTCRSLTWMERHFSSVDGSSLAGRLCSHHLGYVIRNQCVCNVLSDPLQHTPQGLAQSCLLSFR